MSRNSLSKPVSTSDLGLWLVSVLKSVTILLGLLVMEWVRAKKKLAENRAAVLKTDLEIAKKQNEMAKNQGSPDDIIDDFLRR